MFARVTTAQGSPDQLDQAVRYLQEQVIPVARQQRGFKGSYWLADRQTGKVLAVVLWENEDALRASEAAMEQSRSQSAQALGVTMQSVERYEAIAQG